jgi:hypothetical protein
MLKRLHVVTASTVILGLNIIEMAKKVSRACQIKLATFRRREWLNSNGGTFNKVQYKP